MTEVFRKQLKAALTGVRVQPIPHEQLIARLDEAAHVFRLLIIKSSMAIPYTSDLFELDCGYRSAGAESRLRESMAAADAIEHR